MSIGYLAKIDEPTPDATLAGPYIGPCEKAWREQLDLVPMPCLRRSRQRGKADRERRLQRMSDDLPIVLTLRTPGTNAGAVDTEVYCINVTREAVRIAVSSTGFSTIDDEGTLLHHGSAPVELTLAPGEAARIGDVVAWEWDGHVGLFVTFTDVETGRVRRATYNLRHGIDHREPQAHAFAAKGGYITPPGNVQTDNI